jgi:hypothetical protein
METQKVDFKERMWRILPGDGTLPNSKAEEEPYILWLINNREFIYERKNEDSVYLSLGEAYFQKVVSKMVNVGLFRKREIKKRKILWEVRYPIEYQASSSHQDSYFFIAEQMAEKLKEEHETSINPEAIAKLIHRAAEPFEKRRQDLTKLVAGVDFSK